jgi:type VI secretion system secreted protein VgrG
METLHLALASQETPLTVARFSVLEKISTLFRVELVVLSADPDIDPGAVVGQPAMFSASNQLRTRVWSGVCSAMRQIEAEPDGLSTYSISIVPTLWLLTQRRNHRIFSHLSAPEIAKKLLEEWQIEADFRVSDPHPRLEQRVQYGESDHAFLCRILEEAGISFFFEDDIESGSRLVLHDRPNTAPPRAAGRLPFQTLSVEAPEHVRDVRIRLETRPGQRTIRDYDFRRPRLPLIARAAPVLGPESAYEQFEYRPGAFLIEGDATPSMRGDDQGTARHDVNAGGALSKRSLRSTRISRKVVTFETTALDLSPGTVFAIERHPRFDLQADTALLVTELSLEGEADRAWTVRGVAVLAAETYRPPQATPRPSIAGLQSAIVVGPEGEEIHADEHGRVRVQFPWNREGQYDQGVSSWVRVSQGWAGAGYGMFTIPRVGHEVLVAFHEGNPDAPVIVGRVHNSMAQVPYQLPEHETVSTWRSMSTPGGGGFHEIRFDDATGQEQLHLRAEGGMAQLVKNDAAVEVGHTLKRFVRVDELSAVGGDHSVSVQGEERETTGRDRVVVVGGDQHAMVGGNDVIHAGAKLVVKVVPEVSQKLEAEVQRVTAEAQAKPLTRPWPALGTLPADPKAFAPFVPGAASSEDSTVQRSVAAAVGAFDDLAAGARAAERDAGRTQIAIHDKKITLSTGEAWITLEGPNITFAAAGEIRLVPSAQFLASKNLAHAMNLSVVPAVETPAVANEAAAPQPSPTQSS